MSSCRNSNIMAIAQRKKAMQWSYVQTLKLTSVTVSLQEASCDHVDTMYHVGCSLELIVFFFFFF